MQLAAGLALRVEDRAALLLVGGHRLFGDHVAAQLHRADDVLVVRAVLGGDDHHVGLGLADHAVEILRLVNRHFARRPSRAPCRCASLSRPSLRSQ